MWTGCALLNSAPLLRAIHSARVGSSAPSHRSCEVPAVSHATRARRLRAHRNSVLLLPELSARVGHTPTRSLNRVWNRQGQISVRRPPASIAPGVSQRNDTAFFQAIGAWRTRACLCAQTDEVATATVCATRANGHCLVVLIVEPALKLEPAMRLHVKRVVTR